MRVLYPGRNTKMKRDKMTKEEMQHKNNHKSRYVKGCSLCTLEARLTRLLNTPEFEALKPDFMK